MPSDKRGCSLELTRCHMGLRLDEFVVQLEAMRLLVVAAPYRLVQGQQVIAALYVVKGGCYYGLPDVDPWDKARDARLYAGPYPVVAHPPCERWGRYWGGSPTTWPRLKLGDDGGCFAAALDAVRRYGGVLEHPQASHAWRAFGLSMPSMGGAWINADLEGGWTCCVEQGAYGHRARKATWLYAHGVELPSLKWGKADGDFAPLEQGFHSAEERARWKQTGEATAYQTPRERLTTKERSATPTPFRDLLLSMARTAKTYMVAA